MGRLTLLGAGRQPSAAASPTWTKTDNPAVQNPGFATNVATFNSANLGATPGLTVISIAAIGVNSLAFSSLLVGGVSATRAVTSLTGTETRIADIWCASTTNASDNIILTCAQPFGLSWVGITVGKMVGVTATPTQTQRTAFGFNNDPQVTAALTNPGFIIFAMQAEIDGTPTVNTGTLDYNTISGANVFSIVSGNISALGSQTPSVSGYAFAGVSMAAAAWGP